MSAPILEAHSISKSFVRGEQSLTIIDNLSLTISAGETLSIIGKSGAGKSTLLSLLAGLDQPTQGQIMLAGHSLESLDDDARAQLRAQRIGFVFQAFHLLPELSAFDNVRLPMEIQGRDDADDRAHHWLEQVGLGDRQDHLPGQLSGGEQQRVAIARAFAGSPDIVFADEPTGNLDEQTAATLIDQLFALNRAEGTTLILITHDRELAQRCQRCLRLHDGNLSEVEVG